MTTEEMRIYNDAWVTINLTSSYGCYEIEASVWGIKATVTTTDSELYDMWKDEDTREQARQQAFSLCLDSIKEAALDKYYDALYTTNADPALCEDEDTAMMLAELAYMGDKEITLDDVDDDYGEVTTDEWEVMKQKLDLGGYDVQAIHRCGGHGEQALICLQEDR